MPARALAQLLLHQYKDMNSIFLLTTRNCFRDSAFEDIARLLAVVARTVSPTDFSHLCNGLGIVPYAFAVLYATDRRFPGSVPMPYLQALETPEDRELTACYGLNAAERRRWRVGFEERVKAGCCAEILDPERTPHDREKIAWNRRWMQLDADVE